MKSTDRVLIHAGASGVGTAAVQLVKLAGATSYITASSQQKIDFAKSLGAAEGFNYKQGDWAKELMIATDGLFSPFGCRPTHNFLQINVLPLVYIAPVC